MELSEENLVGKIFNRWEVIRFSHCDLEDWEILKNYYWREDMHGYAIAINNHKTIRFHRCVEGLTNPKIQ